MFLDPWHNPSVQEQAGGRITRLSQLAKHVHLWYLLVADSVEEPTHAAAERKRREADYLMHGFVDPNDITTDSLLSLEQLRLVLSSMDDAALAPPMDEWLPAHLGAQPLQLSSLNGMSTLQRMPTNQELLDVLTTNVAADVTNVLVDSGTFGAAEDEETGGTDMTTLAAIRRMVGVQTTSQ